MAWLNLNQSFNSLKGQITNFATEVLSEDPEHDIVAKESVPESSLSDLQEKCKNQELEIAAYKKLSDELQASLQAERLARQNGVKEEESSWYWDPPAQAPKPNDDDRYRVQIRALQDELSSLKERDTIDLRPDSEEEIRRLKEENQNLTTNLEDLDSQHQLAMERLLSLKKELQTNFEALKQDHEELKNTNDEYADEIKTLELKVGERDKEILNLIAVKSDYDTLHHKYQNLERIHALLRENAEKFQEENQDLHEEVFKLEEQVTKLEHDVEILSKNAEVSTTVPKDKYDEILKELNDLRDRRNANQMHLDEINIDDNAKSVIENLKHEINDLRHQLNQKEVENQGDADHKNIKADKIMQMYNKYVNFDIPLDYVGEIPSVGDNIVIYKLESVFKTVNSFKKDIDALEHQVSDKNHSINHLQTQLDDLTAENDFLTTDIQHFERELNEMKKNNDFLISEITTLKNTSKLEPIIETNHEDNLAILETELADCTKVNKTFESEIKKIKTELAEVRKEKTSLQDSLTDLKTKYTTMLSEIDMCKNKTAAVEELEKSVHNQQNDSLKNATVGIEDLKKKLILANSKNEQLSIDKHILENDKVVLMKQVDDLNHTIKEKSSASNDLKDLKLALDHKHHEVESQKIMLKKQITTLEAQLPDNNTVKTGELESIIDEKIKLEEELHKLQVDNNSLTESMTKAVAESAVLNSNNQELKEEIERLKHLSIVSETTTKSQASQEINALKEIIQNLEANNQKHETELSSTDTKIEHLESEFEKLLKDIDEKDELIDALNCTINKNKNDVTSLNKNISELTDSIRNKSEEIERSQQHIERLSSQLSDSEKKYNKVVEELNNAQNDTRILTEESDALKRMIQNDDKNDQIALLQKNNEELMSSLADSTKLVDNNNKEIKELNQSLIEFKDRNKTPENMQNDDYANLLQEKDTIEKKLQDMDKLNVTRQHEITQLEAKITELESVRNECKTAIDTASTEKAELLKYLTLKHNESVQYHNEIQRLNQVLIEKDNELKHAIEEKNQITQNSENCTNCENLRTTMKEKDSIIKTLNQNTAEMERLKAELASASEVVTSLTEKCDETHRSLTAQLEAMKKLTAENAQLSEQEQNSARELERLRRHLVETEEGYTQELMASEQKLTECQTRLHAVEERAKQTSTVYTSNSIRANQEVETLRTQIKLLEKQREEVQVKHSEAEDVRSRSEAALTNLQIVLEQFQLDKEREVKAATEKIRNKMEDHKRENRALQEEIHRLNKKVEESLAGLQAATRLGDQLETKTAQMNDLKEQVRTLQTSVAAAEERYHNAISNQQDKVDKNLLKNLVINYVLTAASSKTQVLRVLSTVLDFNQGECERLGLLRGAAPDSLAQEFVRFLQNESTPRDSAVEAGRSATPAVSRRSSTTGPNPVFNDTKHKRNPSTASSGSNNLLFTNIDSVETSSQLSNLSLSNQTSSDTRPTLDTGINQTRNNEGAILKHVLRDM